MTTLLEQAFNEVQNLSNELQDQIAQQLLENIHNERKWQETLADPDINLDVLQKMAQAALLEEEEGLTEDKGFGEV